MRMPLHGNKRAGTVIPLVAICLVGLIAFIALAIDVGMMAVARTQSQNATDIAALAGERTINGNTGNNVAAAIAEAREAAESNSILASQITDSQVVLTQVGVYRYDATNLRFTADFTNPPTSLEAYGAMQVRITSQQPTYF